MVIRANPTGPLDKVLTCGKAASHTNNFGEVLQPTKPDLDLQEALQCRRSIYAQRTLLPLEEVSKGLKSAAVREIGLL